MGLPCPRAAFFYFRVSESLYLWLKYPLGSQNPKPSSSRWGERDWRRNIWFLKSWPGRDTHYFHGKFIGENESTHQNIRENEHDRQNFWIVYWRCLTLILKICEYNDIALHDYVMLYVTVDLKVEINQVDLI